MSDFPPVCRVYVPGVGPVDAHLGDDGLVHLPWWWEGAFARYTEVQERCTELLEEARAAKRKAEESRRGEDRWRRLAMQFEDDLRDARDTRREAPVQHNDPFRWFRT